jgi:hypothetical protein
MATNSAQIPGPQHRQPPAEREARVRSGQEAIAWGNADIDAGLGIADEDMAVWLDLLDRDPNAAVPTRGRQRTLR